MNGQERLLDLLTARATEGLPEAEVMELDLALLGQTDLGRDELDLAAAAADLAIGSVSARDEPMPESVKRTLLEQARHHLLSSGDEKPPAVVTPSRRPAVSRRRGFDARYLGWYAAAAILLLALWAPWSSGPPAPVPAPTLAEQRAALMRNAGDVIQVEWATPQIEGYAQVSGDVVWSNERQTGFMRLSGLPANRRDVEQYQLWIVDPTRDERPIDGGVFDIPAAAGEIIVPIDAKLHVGSPTVFAITLEQPGGVVVSDGPLLLVAPVRA